MNIIEHFVNGKKFSGNSKRTANVFNPATGEQSAKVKLASAQDLKKHFFCGQKNLPYKERELCLSLKI
jgi:malonate-semialdehyde dehydrogenase (acetylating)/methylmalonate-semialdehyde dehydrogenase